ncbi:MAG: ion transporter [Bacteroidales bacterium]|nr:ion transporter [Bacteroidales bacterium]
MKNLKNLFLNEKFILSIILLNAVVIFLQSFNMDNIWIQITDMICTLIFIVEMGIKHVALGVKNYWKSRWNRLDGTLVILSIPSIIAFLFPISIMDLSFLMILRLLRSLRFLRVLHFFPNIGQVIKGFKLAIRESYAILLCFLLLIVLFGLINCSLFKDMAPMYFETPLKAIYSVFRVCTVEGWYEIPDAIAAATSPTIATLVRIYFSLLLLAGGIIGMSFINSIFVDAMVADNNDDVKAKLDEIEKKIDEISSKLK